MEIDKMKEIFQALVVLLIALPFIYMAYDVTLDIFSRFSRALKPVAINIVNTITNLLK